MINIFQPALGEEELTALKEVFGSNWIGKGDQVLQFEREFASSLKVDPQQFTSTTCCTEGLFLAGELFGLKPGDEIIVPSISFIAVGSAAVASGALLVFCDVDPRTLNVTAECIAAKMTPRTKAIIINHYGGVPCDMDPVLDLCKEKRIALIEDSACAPLRSFYKGRAAGTLGDMGVWSFDAMKILCTGDGGMIYLKDLEKVVQAKEELYLGLPNRQKSGMDSAGSGTASWWEFEINRPGRRAIMNNIAGAIGLQQLKKLDGFIARRKHVYDSYARELAGLSWLRLPPPIPVYCASSYYFFWVQLELRNELAAYLKDKGIYSTFRYWPLHRVSYFGQTQAQLPNSEFAAAHTLNIPLHQSLSDDDADKVISAIKSFGSVRGL